MKGHQEAAQYIAPWFYWGLAVAVATIDQGFKFLVERLFTLGSTLPMNVFFNLVHARNTGAAFSFLAEAGGWQRYLFIAIALAVSVMLALMLRRARPTSEALGYSLVLGGAIGNLVDRSFRGYVVDYLDFYYQTWHWPAFNLADIAIVGGVVLLLASSFSQQTPQAGRTR
ncbi:signal peptidase II [Pseudomonas sp. Marseille-Q5115]|uniref:signal peptidase II n=1 Tax=Pseudomonas sp. Marseille-Q5115 TaxID=2866593 RepID=UPI001CE49069|nr:signal peptidase II [Pseudomonas sp. Marseille-Q5115]